VGLDPLPAKPVGMEFVRGVGESLPFRSNVFDQTVCSTTLDHCLNPVAVLREIKRVTNGKINLWTGIDRRPRDKNLFRKAYALVVAWQFRRMLRGAVTRSTLSVRRVIGSIKHSLGFELDPVQFYDLVRSRYHLRYFTERDLSRILAESSLEIREKKVIDESMFLSVI
jgi:SAM-dependent methyltransferase